MALGVHRILRVWSSLSHTPLSLHEFSKDIRKIRLEKSREPKSQEECGVFLRIPRTQTFSWVSSVNIKKVIGERLLQVLRSLNWDDWTCPPDCQPSGLRKSGTSRESYAVIHNVRFSGSLALWSIEYQWRKLQRAKISPLKEISMSNLLIAKTGKRKVDGGDGDQIPSGLKCVR